jgi:hypothetical protein
MSRSRALDLRKWTPFKRARRRKEDHPPRGVGGGPPPADSGRGKKGEPLQKDSMSATNDKTRPTIVPAKVMPRPPAVERRSGPRSLRARRHSADDVSSKAHTPSSPPKRRRSTGDFPECIKIPSWDDDDDSSPGFEPLPSAPPVVTSPATALQAFSPTKKIKVPARPSTEALKAALLAASNAPQDARAERIALSRANQVLRLYENAARAATLSFDDIRRTSFTAELRKAFPLARAAEIRAMLAFVDDMMEADAARQLKRSHRWRPFDKKALGTLFALVDVDRSGTISVEEFELLASLAEMSRAELRSAFERASAVNAAAGGGADDGLDLPTFVQLLETLPVASLGALRRALSGILTAPSTASGGGSAAAKFLVFDDGRQQLWRTEASDGAETLLERKDTRELEWCHALVGATSVVSCES